MESALERKTMRQIYLRLLPFCFILYFICYLDRVNIGFASLTMNRDLGLSSYVFGIGAGAFFWGYFLLEVPSNLILEKVGASRWIARIMIGWGIVSGCFAFTQGPISFFILRFPLGLAEAGFFPGMILYFTYWFPTHHRARIVAGFMAAIPVSIGLGAPVSTAFLELDGVLGLAGWKWLFLGEAAPAVIFGAICWFYLPDRPAHAKWLTPESKTWLQGEMDKEQKKVETGRRISVLQSLFNWRVLSLGAIHFGQAGVSVGLGRVRRPDHQAARSDQYADRLHDRDPLCRRNHRHAYLGTLLGQAQRAALEPDRIVPNNGFGLRSRRVLRRQLLVGARPVDGDDRALRLERAPIPVASGVLERGGGGERYRLGQFGRYPRRQRVAADRRLSARPDRQFHRRVVRARSVRGWRGADFGHRSARNAGAAEGRGRGCYRCRRVGILEST